MSPRTREQYEEIREEKKRLIMDVALEHFSDRGFHATTISHIARHAGISKGLLYNYFSSKEELLAVIIGRSLSDIYSHFDPDQDGYLSADEFEHFIRKMFGVLAADRRFWRLITGIMMQRGVYESLFSGPSPSMMIGAARADRFFNDLSDQFTDYFNRRRGLKGPGYDPAVEMIVFTSSIKGLALNFIMSDEDFEGSHFEKAVDAIIKLYR